ncbi:hypothetical protein Lal_00045270 [Lupinus albus]|nr:hypothetical protein Lal_00045270 [Lupinus albus]
MASSSRTNKQRSNVTQSKQGTSSLESNPLDLTRLFANNEQCKVFEEHFHVSTAGETKVALNLRESKIDVEVVHKMGFSIDLHDHRTYKHRTDRLTAHAAQPKPTNPNPYEFHAQSFSSAAMPSNQMIMDELFSLRDYITNRMDALDAQNPQIQYELHCLSSKLSIMDIDEDNSEPES